MAGRGWSGCGFEAYGGLPNVSFLSQEFGDLDLANLLVPSDCVILPYLDIVGSSALAESLTLGRGVVLSDLPYFRESLATEPDAGVFFRPGDAAVLDHAVTTFFSLDISRRKAAASRLAKKTCAGRSSSHRWENGCGRTAPKKQSTGVGKGRVRAVDVHSTWSRHSRDVR